MVGFGDELWSGVAVVGAPDVERELGLDHAGYTLAIFALPLLLSALLEGGLALYSDRVERRRLLAGSLVALAAALVGAALAPFPWLLSLSLAAAGAASGITCAAAQGELLARQPDAPERAMLRWSFYCALGDIVAPLVVAGALAAGGSYRTAMLVVAGMVLVHAAAMWRGAARARPALAPEAAAERPPTNLPSSGSATAAATEEDAPPVPLLTALRAAAREPVLWAWLLGVAACTLLDEIVIALAALRLRNELGVPLTAAVGWTFVASAGEALGALLTDRLLGGHSARRLLGASALISAAALLAALWASSVTWLMVALFVLGLASAPHYAIAQARAFATVPGRPGVVNALLQVFVVTDIAAPLLLGVIADGAGLDVAFACLLLQPLAMLLLAARWPLRRV